MSSCLLGIMIGTVVAWTISIQRNVMLGNNVPFSLPFPWGLLFFVTGASILFAFLSSWSPITNLVKQNTIVNLMRS